MSVIDYLVVASVLGISTLGYVLMFIDLKKKMKNKDEE